MPSVSGAKPAPALHKEFYVAVGTQGCKLTTLLELLLALIQEQPFISLLVCCSSRDSLDAVVHGISLLNKFSLWALHSDLTPRELGLQVMGFRQAASAGLPGPCTTTAAAATASSGGSISAGVEGGGQPTDAAAAGARSASSTTSAFRPTGPTATQQQQQQPVVLVATDSSMRALGKESLPLGVAAAIQYDLPPNKDVYLRRMTASFGGARERKGGRRGVVVDFVVAGLVATFRELEGFSLVAVQEMPVQVHDMFLA